MSNPLLYFIPGSTRAQDQIVRASAISNLDAGRKLSESGKPSLHLIECEYRDGWGSIEDVAHAYRIPLECQGAVDVGHASPDWSAGRCLITADGRVHFVRFDRNHLAAGRLPVQVALADMAYLREPGQRKARFQKVIQDALSQEGWRVLIGHSAIAELDVESIGEQEAVAYLSRFDSERVNCTLSASFVSEGQNQCASCSVLLPWDATDSAVRSAAAKFAQDVAQSVEQAFSVRMAKVERQR